MPGPASDRNLLFGILALQMDFITRDALIAAMNAWALEKHRPLGEILIERDALDPKFRALLEPMVDAHVERHGGDPVASLAALSSIESTVATFRSIADPEVLAAIARIPTALQLDDRAARPLQAVANPPVATRYRKVRDHASGGLGIVYVAHDEELRREVALKEIQGRHADDPDKRARFLIEAEVTGNLEHPGIVPVYGLGSYDDGRPFYAMRLINGDSLKHAIAAFHADEALKRDPGALALSLRKLLRRFLDVCNAIDYAHSRGVLHRDIKPDNVMVGRFGETLVVDWGLAKVVGRSGSDDHDPLPESTVSHSSSSGSAETLPGSVIGTPSYMSPEQAAGRLDLLGPASDVYSLGATLYTLLTGRVPFSAFDLGEILRKVELGEFPRPRQLSPWLDPSLEAVALKAMALRPSDRYPSSKALADDIERWLADEPVAAHREPWPRRARRWARKHRTAVTAAASTALVAALLVGASTWASFDRTRRTDVVGGSTLARVEFLEADARRTSDPALWSEAIAEARRAEAQLESGGGSDAAKSRVRAKLAGLQEALGVVERDRKMVADLDEARLSGANLKDGNYDRGAKADAILAAFRSYGIDLLDLTVEEAASRVRPSRLGPGLVAALDEATPSVAKSLGDRLSAVAHLADADVRGVEIRDLIARKDFEGLRYLVAEESGRRELGARCRTIFTTLANLDATASLPALEAIHRANRADFWLTLDLARACQASRPPRLESAIRYFHAAAALRPASPGVFINLGNVLSSKGEIDAAIVAYREAIRLRPDHAGAHHNLGMALASHGDIDAAIAAYREAIRLRPEYAWTHHNLGIALHSKGALDAAIAACREATRHKPELAEAHLGLGNALRSKGEVDAAIAAYREAIRLKPDYAEAHLGLGNALRSKGEVDAAIAAYREAIRLRPDHAGAHHGLGFALRFKGDLDAAIAAYCEAIRLEPNGASVYHNLGLALRSKGEVDAAIAAYREAIRLEPGLAGVHYNLGNALRSKGEVDAAIAAYREAIRLRPDHAEAHCSLGLLLEAEGRFGEALASLERGHELGSRAAGWALHSAEWVQKCRRLVDLDARLPALLKGEAPTPDPAEWLELADLCGKKAYYAASSRYYGRAFAERPQLAEDLNAGHRLGAARAAALAGSGAGKDDPPPDEAARENLREQAMGWLRADLAAREKVVDGGDDAVRKQVARTLGRWKGDGDLAGIRDEAGLAKLPVVERGAFRSLWLDIEALREKAEGVRRP